jgi:hypothetical protein
MYKQNIYSFGQKCCIKYNMDPVSISAIVVAAVAAIAAGVSAIIQALKGGWNCTQSSCCAISADKNDIHDNDRVVVGK